MKYLIIAIISVLPTLQAVVYADDSDPSVAKLAGKALMKPVNTAITLFTLGTGVVDAAQDHNPLDEPLEFTGDVAVNTGKAVIEEAEGIWDIGVMGASLAGDGAKYTGKKAFQFYSWLMED